MEVIPAFCSFQRVGEFLIDGSNAVLFLKGKVFIHKVHKCVCDPTGNIFYWDDAKLSIPVHTSLKCVATGLFFMCLCLICGL